MRDAYWEFTQAEEAAQLEWEAFQEEMDRRGVDLDAMSAQEIADSLDAWRAEATEPDYEDHVQARRAVREAW
jgi:hypothetical protein